MNNCEIPAQNIIRTDSTIEEVFYNKCHQKDKFTNIFVEWINSKPIYEQYTQMINKTYGNYSKHDKSHSIAILDIIYSIVGKDRVEKMSVMDLWLLLQCAYAHDIGMPYTYDEAEGFWRTVQNPDSEFRRFLEACIETTNDKDARKAAEYIINLSSKIQTDEKEIWKNLNVYLNENIDDNWPVRVARYNEYLLTEFCRKNHTRRSQDFMENRANAIVYNSPYVLSARFYRVIATCSMVHGENFSEVLKLDREEWARESDFHPSFVAALLRLGDLLDIDNNRFDCITMQFYGRLPKISELHKEKHDSITHIALSDNKIEVRARSNKLDVCKCINEWFNYIDQEVRNLIFHWEEIAPEELKGCRLTLPDLKIYYNNQEFSSYDSHEFSVNKDMLIRLVVGRNLYASELDFIREYLQNALDALKMKFWLDLEEGILDVEIKEGVLKKLKGQRNMLTPLDFNPSVFRRYGIDIICRLIKEENEENKNDQEETAFVEFKICDRGIGIEEECVKAISNIGSGWKKRSYYKQYIRKMPQWLRPTGGFGIGIQSGFMVADTVVIRTKCDNESVGRQITMYSSEKSGKIEEQQCDTIHHTGTEIIVKIPCEKFMENSEYKGIKLIDPEQYSDFFNTDQIMKASLEIIRKYVSIVADATIFPIVIKREGFESIEIKQQFEEKVVPVNEIQSNGCNFKIYNGFAQTNTNTTNTDDGNLNTVYVWCEENAILCKFQRSKDDKNKISWYYKGMSIEEKGEPKTTYFLAFFPSIKIDIMGGKVDDFLTVDRNHFIDKIDSEKIVRSFVKAYYDGITDMQEVETYINGYWYIWAFFYASNKNLREQIKNVLTNKNQKENREGSKTDQTNDEELDDLYTTIKKELIGVSREDSESFPDEESNDNIDHKPQKIENSAKYDVCPGSKSLLQICADLWNNIPLYLMNRERKQLEYIKTLLLCTEDTEDLIGKEVILSIDLFEIFSHLYINDIKTLLIININPKPINKTSAGEIKIIEYQQTLTKTTGQNISEKIIPVQFNNVKGYEIYWTSECFVELQVIKLPWGYKVDAPEGEFGNQKAHMIICPVSALQRDEDIFKQRIEDKEEPFEELKKFVLSNESFKFLVNWVFRHHASEESYSKEIIRKRYIEFLEWWYKNEYGDKKNH